MNSINVFIFASIISCAFAAMALGPAEVDPTHPTMCYDSENNRFYADGETWQLDYCGISTCHMQNTSGTPQMMVEYASCGVAAVDPPCYMVEDRSKAYPDCCPQPECPDDYVIERENHNAQEKDEEDDFLNEIEDDENGDSYFNHKYNNKFADETNVKDASRMTEQEELAPIEPQPAVESKVNRVQYTFNDDLLIDETNVNEHDFKDYIELTGRSPIGKTMLQIRNEQLEALVEYFYKSLGHLAFKPKKVNPKFHRVIDEEWERSDYKMV